MRFRAALKRNSTAYRLWSAARKRVGKIHDVLFERQGKDYVADDLTSAAIFLLTDNPQVQLSLQTEPVGHALPKPFPAPEPKPEPVKPAPEKPSTPSPAPAGRLADLLATPPSKRR